MVDCSLLVGVRTPSSILLPLIIPRKNAIKLLRPGDEWDLVIIWDRGEIITTLIN